MQETTDLMQPSKLPVVQSVAGNAGFSRVRVRQYPAGTTVMRMVKDQFMPELHGSVEVTIASVGVRTRVPASHWQAVCVPEGSVVEFMLVPQGGARKIIRSVLTIAIVIAAFHFLAPIAPALAAGVAGLGVTLINILIPPKMPAPDAPEDTQGGGGSIRNRYAPGAPTPVVFGDMRFYPPMGALPITFTQGKERFQTVLLNLGYGPLRVDPEDIRIGNQPLSSYEGVTLDILEGWSDEGPIGVYTNEVSSDTRGTILEPNEWVDGLITDPNTDQADLEFLFPSGLVEYNRRGERQTRTVVVDVEYRLYPGGSWTTPGSRVLHDFNEDFEVVPSLENQAFIIPRNFSVRTQTSESRFADRTEKPRPFLRTVRFPARGRYELRVRRTTPAPAEDEQIQDEVQINEIRSVRYEPPILAKGLALLALKVRLTDQKAGGLDNVSVRAQRYYPVYENGRWVDPEETRAVGGDLDKHLTRNPAAAFYWAATGAANKRPVPASAVDNASIVEFWTACAQADARLGTPRYQYDRVFENATRLRDVLTEIAGVGRARVATPSGKLAVTRDRVQTRPKGVFTPRNINRLSGTISFAAYPDAISVSMIDRDGDYQQRDIVAYAEGYSEANAERVENLNGAGITETWRAWEYGRYYLENLRARGETITFTASVDALHNSVGDFVLLRHDVLRSETAGADGDFPGGRIREIVQNANGAATAIRLDEPVHMLAGRTYALNVRTSNPNQLVRTLAVNTQAGEQRVLTLQDPAEAPHGFAVGDLVVFGESEQVAREMLITNIVPQSDLSAAITVVDLANELHDIETVSIPEIPASYVIASDPTVMPPEIVSNLKVTEEVVREGGAGRVLLTLSWRPALTGVPAERFNVYEVVDGEAHGGFAVQNYRLFGSTTDHELQLPPDYTAGDVVRLAVVAISVGGTRRSRMDAPRITYTVVNDGDPASVLNAEAGGGNLLWTVSDTMAGRTRTYSSGTSYFIWRADLADMQLEEGDAITFSANITATPDENYSARLWLRFRDGNDNLLPEIYRGPFERETPVRTGIAGVVPAGAVEVNGCLVVDVTGGTPVEFTVSKLSLTQGRAVVPYAPPVNPNATEGADNNNLRVGVGVNLLKNSRFEGGVRPWARRASTAKTYNLGLVGDTGLMAGSVFTLVGDSKAAAIYEPGTTIGAFYDLEYQPGVAVVPGERLEFSIYLIARRCDAEVLVRFYSETGVFIAESTNIVRVSNTNNHSDRLSSYFRPVIFVAVPDGAAIARPLIRKYETLNGGTSSWVFFTNAYLGRAHAGQTLASPFVPGDIGSVDNTRSIPPHVLVGGAGTISPYNPLSATMSNGVATISVVNFTLHFGDVSVSYNGGSLTGLAAGTGYYIYAQDPTYAGGSVSFISTTTYVNVVEVGALYLGYIVTPSSSSSTTSGTGGGGGGGIRDESYQYVVSV